MTRDKYIFPAVKKTLTIRPALPEETQILTELALRSKAIWGYDEEFMRQCREELTLAPEYVSENEVHLVEQEARIAGFYALKIDGTKATLDLFYIDPACIHAGLGRMLWRHAISQLKWMGVREMSIDADPHAENFYILMGATRIGVTPSGSIPGRMLPLLQFIIQEGE